MIKYCFRHYIFKKNGRGRHQASSRHPDAFYLDRAEQSKHKFLGATSYKDAAVDGLAVKLDRCAMADLEWHMH